LYKHYKTFDEQWHSVKHSISLTGSHHNNVDGEVVEYAARRLSGRPEARKVILSLSDGEPCAGHGNNAKMGRNIIRTCERAREAGIEVYGFGIATKAPQAFYGEENFIYLPDSEIGVEFAKSFVNIVGGGNFKVL
jgi:cobalamin biosynthesis protein CobT